MANSHILEKTIIVICLLLAIYYTIGCPCKILLACHKNKFYLLLTLPLLYVIYNNEIKNK